MRIGMFARSFAGLRSNWLMRDLELLFTSPYFIPKKLLRDALAFEARSLSGRSILDVGCGWQPYRPYFDHIETYVGLDLAYERRPNLVARADMIPIGTHTFDLVLCTEVIEHTSEPGHVLKDLSRILTENGYLVLTAPMSWNLHYEPNDYYRFTRYGLQYLAEGADLDVLKVVRLGGLFTLIGARTADILHRKLVNMPIVHRVKGRYVLASIVVSPISLAFYVIGRALDRADTTDAIGWLIVCQQKHQ